MYSVIFAAKDGSVLSRNHHNVIFLRLPNESRMRKIGRLLPEHEVLIVHRSKSLHYHRMTSSYGFNYAILKHIPNIKKILLVEDSSTHYLMDIEDMVKNGRVMNFSKSTSHYETQIFVPLDFINKFKIQNTQK